ncbi:MAG: hypothetical protein ACQES4_12590 [Bacillota bacterium]
MTQLEKGDINLEEEYVRARGKGDKEHLVSLTETTIRLSQRPLSSLGAEAITAEASLALFIFEQGSNQAQRNNSEILIYCRNRSPSC